MLTLDLTEGWWLKDDGRDVLLSGPGGLEISMPSFAVRRLSHEELPAHATSMLREITYRYLLDPEPCPDSELSLSSTYDPATQSVTPLHVLRLGTHTLWNLPDTVGWLLGGYLGMKQEGRPL
jgi:hypothetical protein